MKQLLVIISVLFLIGCKKENPEARRTSLTGFQVFYSIGSGWVNWNYEMNFDSTGYLQIQEHRQYPEVMDRNKECMMDTTEIKSVQLLLNDLKNIKLDYYYGYGIDKPTDLPTISFKYIYGNFSDSCSIYAPLLNELPQELGSILTFIDKLKLKYDPKD